MKAISLWQPWASAIALGLKTIETRSWATNYRGPIAIHASLTRVGLKQLYPFKEDIMKCFSEKGITNLNELPFGAIVATADLVDCIKIPKDIYGTIYFKGNVVNKELHLIDDEILFGDYTSGRFAWILDNIKALEKPIPTKGKQGFWEIELEA
jgi:hypothetical protein